jgi:hypothetical protein
MLPLQRRAAVGQPCRRGARADERRGGFCSAAGELGGAVGEYGVSGRRRSPFLQAGRSSSGRLSALTCACPLRSGVVVPGSVRLEVTETTQVIFGNVLRRRDWRPLPEPGRVTTVESGLHRWGVETMRKRTEVSPPEVAAALLRRLSRGVCAEVMRGLTRPHYALSPALQPLRARLPGRRA